MADVDIRVVGQESRSVSSSVLVPVGGRAPPPLQSSPLLSPSLRGLNPDQHRSGLSVGMPSQEGVLVPPGTPFRGYFDFDETELQPKKSANMTERVAVPSSEHVAEIVGRQGCKIKALRGKTNTYIKTPVRGEDPVFVVTGRKEDVAAARREIVSAAEHFSQIRASRRQASGGGERGGGGSGGGSTGGSTGGGGGSRVGAVNRPSSPNTHGGQVTIGVRVPVCVVGLVVGPKGATIKRIQQETQTYIVTPGRDKDPVFEVIGSPESVERARREIESYIETRIGPATVGHSGGGSSSSSSREAANAGSSRKHHQQQQQQQQPLPQHHSEDGESVGTYGNCQRNLAGSVAATGSSEVLLGSLIHSGLIDSYDDISRRISATGSDHFPSPLSRQTAQPEIRLFPTCNGDFGSQLYAHAHPIGLYDPDEGGRLGKIAHLMTGDPTFDPTTVDLYAPISSLTNQNPLGPWSELKTGQHYAPSSSPSSSSSSNSLSSSSSSGGGGTLSLASLMLRLSPFTHCTSSSSSSALISELESMLLDGAGSSLIAGCLDPTTRAALTSSSSDHLRIGGCLGVPSSGSGSLLDPRCFLDQDDGCCEDTGYPATVVGSSAMISVLSPVIQDHLASAPRFPYGCASRSPSSSPTESTGSTG